MKRQLRVGILIFIMLFGIGINCVNAAQVSFDQVNLTTIYDFSSNPWEITSDGAGNLIVSDDGGIIWKINPQTGSFSIVDTGIVFLTSAHAVPEGYYFSDYYYSVAFTDSFNVLKWEIPLELDQINHSIGRVSPDSNGNVWFIEDDTTFSKIFKLSHSGPNATVCTLVPVSGLEGYGTYAYDLDFYGGYFWWLNSFREQIVRLNPVPDGNGEYLLEYWQVPSDWTFVGGRENDFDASGNLWISGGGSGKVLRFNPTSKILTAYTPPGIPSVEGVTTEGNQVWYADQYAAVGIFNPEQVTGEDADLTLEYQSVKMKAKDPCVTVPAVTSPVIPVEPGTLPSTLPFTTQSVSADTGIPGWAVYSFPPTDYLAGINSVPGAILVSSPKVSDVSNRKLIRILFDNPSEYQVYLPLIKR